MLNNLHISSSYSNNILDSDYQNALVGDIITFKSPIKRGEILTFATGLTSNKTYTFSTIIVSNAYITVPTFSGCIILVSYNEAESGTKFIIRKLSDPIRFVNKGKIL